jgi:hypothetical protein
VSCVWNRNTASRCCRAATACFVLRQRARPEMRCVCVSMGALGEEGVHNPGGAAGSRLVDAFDLMLPLPPAPPQCPMCRSAIQGVRVLCDP